MQESLIDEDVGATPIDKLPDNPETKTSGNIPSADKQASVPDKQHIPRPVRKPPEKQQIAQPILTKDELDALLD